MTKYSCVPGKDEDPTVRIIVSEATQEDLVSQTGSCVSEECVQCTL